MQILTDLPAWAGFSILLLVDALVLSLARAHDQRQNRRYLHAETERIERWAEERAEQLANERISELRMNVRTKIPVELVNESDINWGEGSRK